jgi:hypothetical protein
MCLGGFALLLLSAVRENDLVLANVTTPIICLSLAYLVRLGSLVGFASYVYLLSVWPVSKVSSYNFI